MGLALALLFFLAESAFDAVDDTDDDLSLPDDELCEDELSDDSDEEAFADTNSRSLRRLLAFAPWSFL